MPQPINKSDYFKNYKNVSLICSAKIKGKKRVRGMRIDLSLPNRKEKFLDDASELFDILERTILDQNGYYKDSLEELEREGTPCGELK